MSRRTPTPRSSTRESSPCAASIEAADYPDELSLNTDVRIELRRICRIGGLEADLVLFLEEALEGDGVRPAAGLLDLGHDDVAVPRRRLGAYQDEIPVRAMGLDHRIAPDAEDVGVAAWRE